MSTNPNHRIEISLEKLNNLREKVCNAFFIAREEEFKIDTYRYGYYYTVLSDIIKLSEGTLFKFFRDDKNRVYDTSTLQIIEEYINKVHSSITSQKDFNVERRTNTKNKHLKKHIRNIMLKNWTTSTNFSTPQWADYLMIPNEEGLIKRVRCQLITTSEYYRFGFKLFRKKGKLFGDGSIQSMDNNFVIHVGKNFFSDELFITTYQNGIRKRPDKYTNIIPSNCRIDIEMFIDGENILYLFLDGTEVFKTIINSEILEQIYMLAWGDGNEYQINVEKIEIEFEYE